MQESRIYNLAVLHKTLFWVQISFVLYCVYAFYFFNNWIYFVFWARPNLELLPVFSKLLPSYDDVNIILKYKKWKIKKKRVAHKNVMVREF